jgi:hypothetical protein
MVGENTLHLLRHCLIFSSAASSYAYLRLLKASERWQQFSLILFKQIRFFFLFKREQTFFGARTQGLLGEITLRAAVVFVASLWVLMNFQDAQKLTYFYSRFFFFFVNRGRSLNQFIH